MHTFCVKNPPESIILQFGEKQGDIVQARIPFSATVFVLLREPGARSVGALTILLIVALERNRCAPDQLMCDKPE